MRDRPSDLTDIVTEEDFKKAQAYNLDKSRFGFVDGLYKQIETVLMLHYDALPYFWNLAGQILYKVTGYGSEYEACVIYLENDIILIFFFLCRFFNP